jgi:transcription antitermination factor NusG
MTPTNSTWYAVWVLTNAEFVVEDALLEYGIESYLPSWVEVVQWSDRKKSTRRPLFPGYLFARADENGKPRRELLRIPGVIQVLPNNLQPAPIEGSDIENIRLAIASGLPMKPCDYVTGDAVRIEHGPLTGVTGIVLKTKDATRVIVRIEMLKRAVSVECDSQDLVKEVAAKEAA